MSQEKSEVSSESLGSPKVASALTGESRIPGFSVQLENFDGPFDLLLQLISRHRLEITEIALAVVTDEFINYIRALEESEEGWRLDQATEFLVVAATLLDLKAARLLPSGEIEDEADLALLEARDLLFARLLQYRAFKQIATILENRIALEERSFPRSVALDPILAALLPEVLIGVRPERFAAIANRVLAPKSAPVLSTEHLHMAMVSVAAEAQFVIGALRRQKSTTFRALIADAANTLVVVARFLALLELYRSSQIRFEQMVALGELQITWTGSESGEVTVGDEFDRPVSDSNSELES